MDPVEQIRFTRELVDINSTTGREGEVGDAIATRLRQMGYDVVTSPVGPRGSDDGLPAALPRVNVFATRESPGVVFSTHMDCVPPFFPSREVDGCVYGRGACDAKGILVAQIAAAERLCAGGERRVGLLFVVGEERGSDGAMAANQAAPSSRFLVNGEPTDNRLARATRGVYRVRLRATGRAAHSSLPHLGESAIDKLVDALVALRRVDWPVDPDLGPTFYTTGLMAGGVAPNVVSPSAEAELMFRTVGEIGPIRARLDAAVGDLVSVEDVLVVPPVRLKTVPGFDTETFSFTTDIPWLARWGSPLLIGPGSITTAHTQDEHVRVAELHRAVDLYVELARTLLSPAG